jgi:hypothetical protein
VKSYKTNKVQLPQRCTQQLCEIHTGRPDVPELRPNGDLMVCLESLVWLWTTVFLFGIRPMIFEGRSILLSVDCGIILMMLRRFWHVSDSCSLWLCHIFFFAMLFIPTRRQELIVNLMSHLILVLAAYTVCRDFRAFRLTHVGFWASRFAWLWWPTACFRNTVLLICSIVYSEPGLLERWIW